MTEHEQPMIPTPGRIVWYQTDGRNFDYWLPAMVTVTLDNQNIEGFNAAGIPVLESEMEVHLSVYSPGEGYVEHSVPYDPDGGRRTWRWPERV